MVLGIISVITSISSVKHADTTPKYASPNTFAACAPTPAAPTVCAIVLSESIADNGMSTFSLYFMSMAADLLPLLAFAISEEIGIDNNIASVMEHKNEVNSAKNK
jgi:hypothetical protein